MDYSRKVLTYVLGGGRGTRLYPLTQYRSKPAVPLAGKYRLIDIPLSNCINSGLNRVYVITQFNSVSLHRHIRRTYTFDHFDGGYVEILAAQQTNEASDWYQGTADAVRQNIRYLEEPDVDYALILSGDQLYRMDYRKMIETHVESGADVTIAALPVQRDEASGLGVMKADDTGRVTGFLEKPKTDKELDLVKMDPAWIDARGVQSKGRTCLASMGIYLFNRKTLIDVLTKTDYQDFGREVFPTSIRTRHVQVHLFDGYWEDIGTIDSFFKANLELASANPPFVLASADAPIYSRARFLPPSRCDDVQIRASLISDGCVIESGAVIENSVIGLRCQIGKGATIRNSVLMGSDDYETEGRLGVIGQEGLPPIGIGPNSYIDGAIIDKNCRIGTGVRVANDHKLDELPEQDNCTIRDGIIVVGKGAVLPDGWCGPG
ncbi:MAG: glucose-1-phosphate adenylyltransferase [Pirellulales bacterium]